MELYDYHDPVSLAVLFEEVKGFDPYVSKKVFTEEATHENDKISVEIYYGTDQIAQYAQKGGDPNVVGKGKSVTKTWQAPKLKERLIFTAEEIEQFQVHDDSDSAIKMANDAITREVSRLLERFNRRMEQMCCEAIVKGKIEIGQANIDAVIDFGLKSDQFFANTTAATKWSATTGDVITKDITKMRRNIAKKIGAAGDLLLLGCDAGDAFRSNADIKKQLDTSYNDIGALKLQEDMGPSGTYLGKYNGVYIFEYHGQYTDINGNIVDMIPAKKAVCLATKARAFGMNYGGISRSAGTEKFVKERTKLKVEVYEDPRHEYIEWTVESKPLPTIIRPDALQIGEVL